MYIYVAVLLVSLFFASILMEIKKIPVTKLCYKNISISKIYLEYILLFLSMLPFVLLCGFRYEVGADYSYTYTLIYDLISQGMSFSEVNAVRNCEISFYLLNKLIYSLGGGYIYLFTVTSAIIIVLFFIGFYQQSNNLCLSIVLFFCAESFFISLCYIRQFMARAIVFYGLKYLGSKDKNSTIKFLICIVTAVSFHTSAIILIFWLIAGYIKIRPEILIAIISVFSVFKGKFEKILINLLKHTFYSYTIGTPYQSTVRFYSTRPIVYILIFILAWIFYEKCKADRNYYLMLNTVALLILITVNFDIMPQLDRVTWYFETIILLFIPYLIKQINNEWLKKVVTIGLIAIIAVFTYHNIVVNLSHGVLPYRFVFTPSAVIF